MRGCILCTYDWSIPQIAPVVSIRYNIVAKANHPHSTESPQRKNYIKYELGIYPMTKTQFMQKRGVQKYAISAWLAQCI